MANRLKDKVAIITGAASGQGRVGALAFAGEGSCLVLTDMDEPRLASAAAQARESGAEVVTVLADLTQEEENQRLVEQAFTSFGRLDVLYHNAGRVRMSPIHEATLEDWNFSVANELTIVFLTCKYALRAMLKGGGGSIVNTASLSGLFGVKGHGVHAATKGGVIGLTRQMAVEYGPAGIRCNAIAPSFIQFEAEEAGFRARHGVTPVDEFPLGRLARPQDPVNMAVFLASDESSFITGQTFIVDGGKSAH
jgi:3-oxoacyl-[acyl-carrier protein] reductase